MTRPSSLEPTQLRIPVLPPGASRQSAAAPTPSSTKSHPSFATEGPTPFVWQSWPIVDEAKRSWSLIAGLVAVAALAGWLMNDVATGFVAALVLAVSVWPLWLPTIYEINSLGIDLRRLGRGRRIPWSQLGAAEIHANGIAFRGPNRGVFLPFARHRDAVLAACMPRLPDGTLAPTQTV